MARATAANPSGTNGSSTGTNPTANSLNGGNTAVVDQSTGQMGLFTHIDQRRNEDVKALRELLDQQNKAISEASTTRLEVARRLQQYGEVVEIPGLDLNVNADQPRPYSGRGRRPGSKNKAKADATAPTTKRGPGRKSQNADELPDTQKVLRIMQAHKVKMTSGEINEAVKAKYPDLSSKKIESALQALRGRRDAKSGKIIGIPKVKVTGKPRDYRYQAKV